ncbi:unnamed protein product, partial [Ectocarpus sp. 13 AM-2016]
MKAKGSRRRVERELLAMRDEAQQQASGGTYRSSSHRDRGASRKHQGTDGGSADGWRYSEDTASQLSNTEGRGGGGRSAGSMAGAGSATDDSCGEEEERAPFSRTPKAPLSSSTRLALAEKTLAEVTAQRDDALELLESSRQENARLTAELDRARSYKALYAAAHHEHQGMKASLAASTQICMGQQKLIQMLQQTSSAPPPALDPEDFLASVGGGGGRPPPP